MTTQTKIDHLLENQQAYSGSFAHGSLSGAPALKVAVVTCMDCRIEPAGLLGISEGDAHLLRNAGGVVTEDVLRSLIISQQKLGTREIMLIQHTQCGMLTFENEEFKDQLESQVGQRPEIHFHPFRDLEENVKHSIEKIRQCPFLIERNQVRGFIYDVASGRLNEVET